MNIEMTQDCIDFILSHADDIINDINDFGELKEDLTNILSAKTDELLDRELYRRRQ